MPPSAGGVGQVTVMEAVAVEVPSLPVLAVAVLLIVPHEVMFVAEVRCTCLLALDPRSPKLQVRAPLEMEQPVSLPAASMVQLVPAVVGRVSDTVTAVAVPAPLFVAVIRNPIALPDATLAASAVFARLIAPQFTVWVAVLASLSRFASTAALSSAVFTRPSAQSAEIDTVLSVIVRVEPFVMVPKSQLSRPAVMVQAAALVPPKVQVWP